MKQLLLMVSLLLALGVSVPAVSAQGTVKGGPDPSTLRDPELEKDSTHNLQVARQYFKLKKAYVAALKRTEETIAGNPTFSKIDEVLYIAGASSLYLADKKGKQAPALYNKDFTPEQFRDLGREYLTKLIDDYPDSSFRDEAQEALRNAGLAKKQ